VKIRNGQGVGDSANNERKRGEEERKGGGGIWE
jgi:hypothetical protein